MVLPVLDINLLLFKIKTTTRYHDYVGNAYGFGRTFQLISNPKTIKGG